MATTKTPIGKVKPIRGIDYWTEQDKQEIRTEVDAAALAANEAANRANTAAQSAETNSTAAEQAATEANDAANAAQQSTTAANQAAADANDAAQRAETAITNIQVATGSAAGATSAANSAAQAANEAAVKATDAANNSLQNAKTYTDEKIAALVGGAPETLNTIDEVAAAIEANEGVVNALNASIGNKVDKVSGKGLSTNDYTTAEKNKLSGIATGAEVNQNAFANVKVGSTTIAADAKSDTLTLVAGSNITLTPNASGDSITIASTGADTSKDKGWTSVSISNSKITALNSGVKYCVKNGICYITGGIKASDTINDYLSIGNVPVPNISIYAPAKYRKEPTYQESYFSIGTGGVFNIYYPIANESIYFNFSYPVA